MTFRTRSRYTSCTGRNIKALDDSNIMAECLGALILQWIFFFFCFNDYYLFYLQLTGITTKFRSGELFNLYLVKIEKTILQITVVTKSIIV